VLADWLIDADWRNPGANYMITPWYSAIGPRKAGHLLLSAGPAPLSRVHPT
jgi:hypothetical protein